MVKKVAEYAREMDSDFLGKKETTLEYWMCAALITDSVRCSVVFEVLFFIVFEKAKKIYSRKKKFTPLPTVGRFFRVRVFIL